ncbi:methyltransferase domain-containing protein [Chloroflexota bacterium]
MVLTIVKVLFRRYRVELFRFFLKTFSLNDKSICDIGGISTGFETLSQFCKCVIINNDIKARTEEGWVLIVADGRTLPFRNGTFDIIISNAVLEHIAWGREIFAQEIRRVTRGGIFISVPYYYAPFEPHYRLPFFQFVPEFIKRFLLFKIGLKIGGMSRNNYHEIRLFKKRELMSLFPEAQIKVFRVFGIPISLIVICKKGSEL